MDHRPVVREPVVITGIGLITSVGNDRESTWAALQRGESRFRKLRGLSGIPDDEFIGACVDIDGLPEGQMKMVPLCDRATAEAFEDAGIDFSTVDPERFGCMVSAHIGDTRWVDNDEGLIDVSQTGYPEWWLQFLPDTSCTTIGRKYGLYGPRLSHSTACASSLISVLSAARSIRDGQCDIALAGGGDAIHPAFVAGFNRMRVLAKDDDPARACRPFDATRKGFVFGEGAAMFVIERLGHALRRGAKIYAEIAATRALAQAHHVTSIDADSDSLVRLIGDTLQHAHLHPADIGYINAHGTGTEQNDAAEATGITRVFGDDVRHTCVSATKSSLGHMINAAGAAELAVTALAMRDGFAPPTLNLNDPDPLCTFDCVPRVGRINQFQHALKLSLAFGGHLVAVLLSRWNDPATGFGYPTRTKAA